MTQTLREGTCVACAKDAPGVTDAERAEWKPQIPDWESVLVDGEERLKRTFKFKNFIEALEFTNKVGAAAEAEDHHPSLLTEWGKVTVCWWTHKIQGLHKNDFVMAARTDAVYAGGS